MNFQAIWTQVKELFGKIPPKHRKQLIILVSIVVILAIVVGVLVARTVWVVLPGSGENPAEVYTALGEMNIPAQVRNGIIYVPEERAGEAQMRLLGEGLLGPPGLDLSIMADATGFGITADHARQLYNFQMGENVRRQLLTIPEIHDAIVLIQPGETSPFRVQQNLRPATASAMLTLRGNVLTQAQANAIAEVIRAAVPGILPENIVIIDDGMINYTTGDITQDIEILVAQRQALKSNLEMNIRNQVEDLLRPIFGPANVQVQPSVTLNFDERVTESVEFAPPVAGELEGLVRSLEEIRERARRWDPAMGIPGTDENAMGMGTIEYPWGPWGDDIEYMREVIGRNFELNETRVRIDHEQGNISALTIGIFVNSEVEELDYDELDIGALAEVVAGALGVSPAVVALQAVPFSYLDATMEEMRVRIEEEAARARTRDIIEMIIMYAVILLLGVMIFLLGRTIVNALRPPEPEPILVGGPEGFDITIDDDLPEEQVFEEIDISQKSAGLEQIERFIDKDSAAVAQLLKNWLADD